MNTEFLQEQKRVEEVVELISEQIQKLEKETSQLKNEVVHIRRHFWDEVKVNVDSFDDFLETIIGLRQEAQALSVRQSTHKQVSKRLSTYRRMLEVPYFGRIDFKEEGATATEQVYIGISTFTDPSGENFLIYDWRAPISSVYYDYQPGPAKYTTPGGDIEGILEKKMQYLIRNGILQSMFDTSITIGDEILQKVLGKGTDKKMHNIVATIQKEQNRIIRETRSRLLIVHGAAGSGKTSAALQRIAYLLYKYRDSLNSEQIILFSPNSLFNNYVSNVLPELGEENMQQVTFQEYLEHRLGNEFHLENPYDQLEYVLTGENSPSYHSRIASIHFKASFQFFNVILAYRQELEHSGMLFKDIKFRGKTIISAQNIANQFYGYDTSLRFHNRLEKLQDWLMKQLKEFEKKEQKKPWVQAEIELLNKDDYQKVYEQFVKKHGTNDDESFDYEMEHKLLAQLVVRRRMKLLRKQIKGFNFVDTKGMYKEIFTNRKLIKNGSNKGTPLEWEEICELTKKMIDENKLFYEDATPFLLLKELILGFQINSSIKHIVIDEAQDYSPFQFEFLKRLFPSAKMTILGDFNQAIFAHARETMDFNALTRLYGPEKTEIINMNRSYRSTKPIIEFTRTLLPGGEKIIPFERDGNKPTLTRVDDYKELHQAIKTKVIELQTKDYNTIAIICKSVEESRIAYEGLGHIEGTKLLKMGSLEYEQGVIVIPSYLSKGIEFDAVIIYNASEEVYGDKSLRKVFYTACTRAMHDLHLYSLGKPSAFLEKTIQKGLLNLSS